MSALRFLLACASLVMLVSPSSASPRQAEADPGVNAANHGISFDYANFNVPIAGVAAGQDVVFVGEPLNATVIVLSRLTGKQIGKLLPPPHGFALPFIMHIIGKNKVAILDAGGAAPAQSLRSREPDHLRVLLQLHLRPGVFGSACPYSELRQRSDWLLRRLHPVAGWPLSSN